MGRCIFKWYVAHSTRHIIIFCFSIYRIPLLMSGQIERLSNANSVMYVVRKLKIPLDYAVKFVTIMSMKRAKSLPYLVVWKKPHMTLPKRYVMPETPPLIIFRKGIFLPPPNAL